MRHGLTVEVYRPAGLPDCSLNGVTARFDNFLLVGEGVAGPVSEADAARLGYLVLRLVPRPGYVYALPDYVKGDGIGGWSFGGNFVYSSDNRFARLNNGCPIKVFDRDEGGKLAYGPKSKNFIYKKTRLDKNHQIEHYGDVLVRVGLKDQTVTITDKEGQPADFKDLPLHVWEDIVRWVRNPHN